MACEIQSKITKLKIQMDQTNDMLKSQKNHKHNMQTIEREYGTDVSKYPLSIQQYVASTHPDKGRIDIRKIEPVREINMLNQLRKYSDNPIRELIFNIIARKKTKVFSENLAGKSVDDNEFASKLFKAMNLIFPVGKTVTKVRTTNIAYTPVGKVDKKADDVAVVHNAIKSVQEVTDENGNKSMQVLNDSVPNVLALLFGSSKDTVVNKVNINQGTNENGFSDIDDLIIRGAMVAMADLYKTQSSDPDYNDGKPFNSMWMLGDNPSGLDRSTAKFMMQNGQIPKSVAINKIGEAIYKTLPMKFGKNLDDNAQSMAEKSLGIIGMQWLEDHGIIAISNSSNVEKVDGKLTKLTFRNMPTVVLSLNDVTNPKTAAINDVLFKEVSGKTKKVKDDNGNITEVSTKSKTFTQQDIMMAADLFADLGEAKQTHGRTNVPLETTADDVARGSNTKIGKIVSNSLNVMNAKPKSFNDHAIEMLNEYKAAIASVGTGDNSKMNLLWSKVGLDWEQLNDPYIDNKNPGTNIKEQDSLQSKISSYRIEFIKAMEIIDQQQQDPFFESHDFTVSQRFMVDATANGQSFKIVRNLMTSEDLETTMKVNNKGEFDTKELEIFKLSMAQGLGIGIDKKLDGTALVELDEIVTISDTGKVDFNVDNKIGQALKIVVRALTYPDANYSAESKKIIDTAFKTLNHKAEGPHAIQAAYAIKQLNKFIADNAKLDDGEKKTEFKHNLTMESDAITSGMILSLIDIGTKEAILMAEKGGVYTDDRIEHWKKVAGVYGITLATDKNGKPKITHGALVEIGNKTAKILEAVEDARFDDLNNQTMVNMKNKAKANDARQAVAQAAIRLDEAQAAKDNMDMALKNAGIEGGLENAQFYDFYNTVAVSVNKSIREKIIKLKTLKYDAIAINDKLLAKNKKAKLDQNSFIHDLDIAFMESIGKFNRSMAKPLVMVYVYGSSISSIKNKLVEISAEPMVYNIIRKMNKAFMDHSSGFTATVDPIHAIVKLLNTQNSINSNPKNYKNKDFKKIEFLDSNQKVMIKTLLKSYGLAATKVVDDAGNETDEYTYVVNDTYWSGYGDSKAENKVVTPTYKYFNPETERMETYKFEYKSDGELKAKLPEGVVLTLDNLMIDQNVLKSELKFTIDKTIGAAFEEGFEQFKIIDEQRMKLKVVEMLRFTMFKATYGKLIEELVAAKTHGDPTVEYTLSGADIEKIMETILKEELGHVMPNIYKEQQPLGKTERVDGEDAGSVIVSMREPMNTDLGRSVTGSTISIRDMIANLGGAPVISTHSKDGYIDSISSLAYNLIRVYDGIVSGGNAIVPATEAYNETAFDVFNFGTLDSQLVALNKSMQSMKAKYEKGKWRDVLFSSLSDKEMQNFIENIKKIGIDINDHETSLGISYDDTTKSSYGKIIDSALVTKNKFLLSIKDKIHMLHSYGTDQADPSNKVIEPHKDSSLDRTDELMFAFADMVKLAKYETKMIDALNTLPDDGAKNHIMKLFDKLKDC